MIEFEWRDDRRCVAMGLIVGGVMAMDGEYISVPACAKDVGIAKFATEAEARAVVEAAVVAAIGSPRARPLSEYHEDMGPVLWWKFPITEPPYVGSPLDLGRSIPVSVDGHNFGVDVGGWPNYHTHFTPLPELPEPPQ